MKTFISLLFTGIIGISLATAVEPFRKNSAAEAKIAGAKAEYYRNYDQIDAHFKFAGFLYDKGLIESAFFNAESALRTFGGEQCRDEFDRHTRRKLTRLLTPELIKSTPKLHPEQQNKIIQDALKEQAKKSPAAAEYLHFAGNPAQWNSRKTKDIDFIRQQIADAEKKHLISHLLEYNSAAANFLYLSAKDYDAALPFFIRLYFHDPEYRTMLQAPIGFTINKISQRITPYRRTAAEIASRRDPVQLIIGYMHTHPRTVESYLNVNRNKFTPEKFTKLCLLASDSVDMQLRSFAFSELMRRDLRPLLPLLESLLADPDQGRQAVAMLMLPYAVPENKLPEVLAEFAVNESAVVRMSAEAVAKKCCHGENYTKFKTLVERKK